MECESFYLSTYQCESFSLSIFGKSCVSNISLSFCIIIMVGTHKKRQVACMFLFFTLCRNVQLVCSHFHHWFVYDILNILFLILTLNATLARERECCCPYIKAK